jgi:hypothetical protein
LSPGAIWSAWWTLCEKPVSVLTSSCNQMLRTPLEPAFSISSVGGCGLKVSVSPACGSSGFGAVIATPGMGPATDGAVGLELLAASHAPRQTTAARAMSPFAG